MNAPTSPVTPVGLLRAALAADGGRPLVTFYDDASGERVELSVATFDNWVAKTANLVRDGLGLDEGARVALLLPTHWQTQVWLLACWSAGVLADLGGDAAEADAVVACPPTLAAGLACPGERLALALRHLGAPFPQPPVGYLDYAIEAPGHGDVFAPYVPVDPDAPGCLVSGKPLTGRELAEAGRARAAELGVGPGDRLLFSGEFDTLDGLAHGLLTPLAAGASVVLCRNLDPAALERRLAAERVTHLVPTP